jgi:uncharacterized membrane protein YkvA (DUF1232 family)
MEEKLIKWDPNMENKYDDFYKKLRKKIDDYLASKNVEYADLLLLVPDFFHLLVKLMLDKRVPADKKLKLSAAIAYFITPFDIIPEAIFGPVGYMDDLALAAYVLNEFINQGDLDLIYEHWAGRGDVLASIQNVLTVADYYLGKGLWQRIRNNFNRQV